MTEKQILELLKQKGLEVKRTDREGNGAKELSELTGLSVSFVNQVLRGERKPSNPLLKVIGYEKTTVYRKIDDGK